MQVLSPNDQTLKSSLTTTSVPPNLYHYTLCRKQANTFSLLSNWRILVYNETSHTLYYVNQPDNKPFNVGEVLGNPRKEVVAVGVAVIKRDGKGLVVGFRRGAGAGEWRFGLETEELAQKWEQLIRGKKEQRAARVLGVQGDTAGMVSDVVGYGMVGQRKVEEDKDSEEENNAVLRNYLLNPNYQPSQSPPREPSPLQQSVKKQPNKQIITGNMTESRILPQTRPVPMLESKKSVPESHNLNNSIVRQSAANQKLLQSNNSKALGQSNRNSRIETKPIAGDNRISIRVSQQRRLAPNNPNPQPSTNSMPQNSSPEQRKAPSTDWNLHFHSQPSSVTLVHFQQSATNTYMSLQPLSTCLRTDGGQPTPKKCEKNGIIFTMAEVGSKQAYAMQRELDNYHHIMRCVGGGGRVDVPLCCGIEYAGMYCLAKARLIGKKVQNVGSVRNISQVLAQLQSATNISTDHLKKSATFYQMPAQYNTPNSPQPTIYLDDLLQYLPCSPDCTPGHETTIRSQLLQDRVDNVINPQLAQTHKYMAQIVNHCVHELCQVLSQHKIILVDYGQLQEVLDEYGLGLEQLGRLYQGTRSRLHKRFLHSVMLAIVVKNQIEREIIECRENSEGQHMVEVVEQSMSRYLGPRDGQNSQLWKDLGQEFKKKHHMLMNFNDITEQCLLACLIELLGAELDMTKLDKSKKIFIDEGVITPSFILSLQPRSSSYDRWQSPQVTQVTSLMRTPQPNLAPLATLLPLHAPEQIILPPPSTLKLLQFLSLHLAELQRSHPQLHSTVLSHLNSEPPTHTSHTITINFINHCLRENKIALYKETVERSVNLVEYWLGQDHVLLCQVYESLAEYYGKKGNAEDSVNFMKQALTTCIRSIGTHTQRTGLQYYRLAEKQYLCGDREQARQNYHKAKLNLQSAIDQAPAQQYTLLLHRIASLQLHDGHTDKAIQHAIKAIKAADNSRLPDAVVIRLYDLLSRAYEINGEYEEMSNLANLLAKVFNRTSNSYTFELMMRLCVIGLFRGMVPLGREKFREFLRLVHSGEARKEAQIAGIEALMDMSRSIVVMQKFAKAANNIDRHITEFKSNRKPSSESESTRNLLQLVVHCLGMQFFQGLLQQCRCS